MHLVALAHARRVHKPHRGPVVVDHDVHGIARGAGNVAHDGALGPGQGIRERRLAHVRPANDGHVEAVLRIALLGLLGEGRDHLVEKVARAVAVRCAHRVRLAHPHRKELPEPVLVGGVVVLVGDDDHRPLRATQRAGHLLVLLGDAGAPVHHEEDHVGLLAGGERLLADAPGEAVRRAGRLYASGVHEHELVARPIGIVV